MSIFEVHSGPITHQSLMNKRKDELARMIMQGLDAEPSEIVVVATRRAAEHAGFLEGRRHPKNPKIMAWWPDLGLAQIVMGRWQRVTVDSSARRCDHRVLVEALEYLRRGQQVFGAAAIWMEF